MLTPIKVPGKRNATQRAERKRVRNRQGPQAPGRPIKPLVFSRSTQSPTVSPSISAPKKPKERSLKNIKSKWKMAELERLPVEVLETIFFFSMNLSFPNASPVICGKLSSHHVYIHTILRAFGPTWEAWYGFVKITPMIEDLPNWRREVEENPLAVPGDPDLQSSLLQCRWATVPILRKAEDIWLRKALEIQTLMDSALAALAPSLFPLDDSISQSQTRVPHVALPGLSSQTSVAETRLSEVLAQNPARWYGEVTDDAFNKDYNNFKALMASQTGPDAARHFIRPPWKWNGFLRIHPRTSIPERLLSGPWDEDMILQLFWFARAGVEVDLLYSTSGETSRRGIQQAIKDGNLEVLYIFQCLGLHESMSDEVEWAVQHAGGDRTAVVSRVLDMEASRYPGDTSLWDQWFSRISTAAMMRVGGHEQKRREWEWAEAFVEHWLSLPPIQTLNQLMNTLIAQSF